MGGGVHLWVGGGGVSTQYSQQRAMAVTRVGGSQRFPTICFLSQELRLRLVNSCSFSGQLPHFSGSKVHPFQF